MKTTWSRSTSSAWRAFSCRSPRYGRYSARSTPTTGSPRSAGGACPKPCARSGHPSRTELQIAFRGKVLVRRRENGGQVLVPDHDGGRLEHAQDQVRGTALPGDRGRAQPGHAHSGRVEAVQAVGQRPAGHLEGGPLLGRWRGGPQRAEKLIAS